MTDNDYYRRRIAEELAAAEAAAHSSISNIHREMAEEYRRKLQARLPHAGGAPGTAPESRQGAERGFSPA